MSPSQHGRSGLWPVELLLAALAVVTVLAYGGVTEPVRWTAVGLIGAAGFILAFTLKRRAEPLLPWGPLHWPAAAMALLACLSIPLAMEHHGSLLAATQGLAALTIYWIGFRAFRRRSILRRWILGFITFVSIIAAFGLALRILDMPREWWWQPEFVSATYVNHNHFAGLVELALPLALALVIYERHAMARLGAALCTAILGTGLLASLSRGGLAASFVAILLMLGAAARLPSDFRLKQWAGLATAILLVSGLALFLGLEPLIERIEDTLADSRRGLDASGRWLLYKSAWTMALEHPLTGVGVGGFYLALLTFRPDGLLGWERYAHNDYLHYLAELGWLAVPVMIWLAVSLVRSLFHYLANSPSRFRFAVVLGGGAGLVSLLIHALIDFNFHIPANGYIACWLAGVVTGYGSDGFAPGFKGEFIYRNRKAAPEPLPPPQPVAAWKAALFLGLSVSLILTGLWQSGAWGLFEWGQKISRRSGIADGIPWMRRSLALDPLSPERRHRLGQIMFQHVHPKYPEVLEEAVSLLGRSVEQSPRHPAYREDYAHALELAVRRKTGRKGVDPSVERAWLALAQADPRNGYYRLLVGRYYERAGNWRRAAEEYLAPVLDPGATDITVREWRVGSENFLAHPETRRQAAVLLEEAREAQPDRTVIARIQARMLIRNRQFKQAVEVMDRTWRQSRLEEDRRLWIEAMIHAGMLAEAENAARAADNGAPLEVPASLARQFVAAYAQRHDFAGTARVMREMLRDEDYDPELMYRRSWAEYWIKNYDAAEAWAHRWTTAEPGERSNLWLGQVFETQRKYLLALTAYRRAEAANPKGLDAKKALARVREKMEKEAGEREREHQEDLMKRYLPSMPSPEANRP